LRNDFDVESVEKLDNGIRVGIIVYRRFQPPVTVVFEQEWGGELECIAGNDCRADGSGIYAPALSKKWIDYAKIFASIIIKSRVKKRDKDIFWAGQPRLFD